MLSVRERLVFRSRRSTLSLAHESTAIRIVLRVILAVVVSSAGGTFAWGQVGATRVQLDGMFDRIGEGKRDRSEKKHGWQIMRYQWRHGATPVVRDLTCAATLDHDQAIAVRWGPFHAEESWRQTLSLISKLNWRITQGRLQRHPLILQPACTAVYPAVGTWSTLLQPITRTIGETRTVMFDSSTGAISGFSPWEDVKVPTGKIAVIHSQQGANVAVLMSPDQSLYAVILATKKRINRESDFQVQSVTLCTGDYFWQSAFDEIETAVGDYEKYLAQVVPPLALHNVRNQRRLAAVVLALNMSQYPLPALQEKFQSLARDMPAASAQVQAAVSYRLLSAPFVLKERRVSFAENSLEKEQIAAIVLPLTQTSYKSKELAVTTLRRLAEKHYLPAVPAPSADYGTWMEWGRAAKLISGAKDGNPMEDPWPFWRDTTGNGR